MKLRLFLRHFEVDGPVFRLEAPIFDLRQSAGAIGGLKRSF
jgi:hypothetical protein